MTIQEENTILKNNTNIKSTFLKVGHHGSDTSTGSLFLNKVNPNYSMISVGKNNSYGHPNISVLKRLEATSKVYRTDLDGTIIMTSDGENINFKTIKTYTDGD